MNIEEFSKTGFGAGDKVIYKGVEYPIYSMDFVGSLFAINNYNDESNLSWVRCENVELVPF